MVESFETLERPAKEDLIDYGGRVEPRIVNRIFRGALKSAFHFTAWQFLGEVTVVASRQWALSRAFS